MSESSKDEDEKLPSASDGRRTSVESASKSSVESASKSSVSQGKGRTNENESAEQPGSEDDETKDSLTTNGTNEEHIIDQPHNPDVAVGQSHVVPLTGLFCRLCRKFYKDRAIAEEHCKSEAHFTKHQKYLKALKVKKKREEQIGVQKEENNDQAVVTEEPSEG